MRYFHIITYFLVTIMLIELTEFNKIVAAKNTSKRSGNRDEPRVWYSKAHA